MVDKPRPGKTNDLEGDEGEPGQTPNATVFALKLGDRQKDPRHFCYACVGILPGGTPAAREKEVTCTIFVTVPSEGPGETQTLPPPDSGSFFPPLRGWAVLSAVGCVLGLVLD